MARIVRCALNKKFCYQRWFKYSLLITLLACFSLNCGYTTRSTLPSSIKTIHIESFANSISFTVQEGHHVYLPLLEIDVRNAVVDRFLFDGNLKVAKDDMADLVLKGELTSYNRGGLRYTDDEDVQEYRVQITVALKMWNTKNEEFAWEESLVGEATYFVTGAQATTEDSAVKEAILDLARRIVERTIEDW